MDNTRLMRSIFESLEERTIGAGFPDSDFPRIEEFCREVSRRALGVRFLGSEYEKVVTNVPLPAVETINTEGDPIKIQLLFQVTVYRGKRFNSAWDVVTISWGGSAESRNSSKVTGAFEDFFRRYPDMGGVAVVRMMFSKDRKWQEISKFITAGRNNLRWILDHEFSHIQRGMSTRLNIRDSIAVYSARKERGMYSYATTPEELEAHITAMITRWSKLGPRQRARMTLKDLVVKTGVDPMYFPIFERPEIKRKILKRLWDHGVKLRS